jgi:hypothetical protein
MRIKIKKMKPAVLPYAGTSGHAGSATSRERARRLDESGATQKNQDAAWRLLLERGSIGLTGLELTEHLGSAHTTGPSVLSVLHKDGQVRKLTEARKGHQVYVLPGYVNDRDETPHRPHRGAAVVRKIITVLDEYEDGDLPGADALRMIREIAGSE